MMAQNEISIRIAADGTMLVAEAGKAVRALDSIGVAGQRASAGAAGGFQKAERQLNEYGQSAAQTAAAMRQLPAQMTDIISGLSTGQSPFTVLLQQGGQLRDAFGGIRPALAAVGGELIGMINPATLAAGAAAALAVAYYQGSKEIDGFNRALAVTNDLSGVTANQLSDMAARIGQVAGTRAQAAETLAMLVESGSVAGTSLEQFAQTAIRSQKALGIEVGETVKEFAELAKDPVGASLKLTEKYHYLTASVYEQIKALQEQGKTQQAVALAQRELANAHDQMSDRVLERLGSIEKGWNRVKAAVADTWSYIKGIGRESTLQEQLAETQGRLAAIRKNNAPAQDLSKLDPTTRAILEKQRASRQGAVDQDEAQLRAQEAALQEKIRLEGRAAESAAQFRRQQEAGVAALDAVTRLQDKGASKQQQWNKALADYNRQLDAIRKANPNSEALSPENIAAGKKRLRDEIYGTGGGARRGAIAAPTDNDMASLQAKIDAANQEIVTTEKLNEGQKLSLQIGEQIKLATDAKVKASLQRKQALADELGAIQQHNQIERDYAQQQQQQDANRTREIDQLKASTEEWKNKVATYGLAGSALDELMLAQVDAELFEKRWAQALDQSNAALAKEVTFLQQKRDLLAQKVESRQQYEGMEQSDKDAKEFAKERQKEAQELLGTYRGVFQGMEDAMVDFVNGGKAGFKDLANSIINDLIRVAIRRNMIQPLQDALLGGSGQSSPSGWFTQLIGGLSGSSGVISMTPGFLNSGYIPSAASGFDIPRGVNPMTQLHEREMVLPAQYADVIRGMAQGGGGGGSNVQVIVNNHSGQAVETRESESGGQRRIEVVVGEAVAAETRRSGSATNKAMRQSFGLQPAMIRR